MCVKSTEKHTRKNSPVMGGSSSPLPPQLPPVMGAGGQRKRTQRPMGLWMRAASQELWPPGPPNPSLPLPSLGPYTTLPIGPIQPGAREPER